MTNQQTSGISPGDVARSLFRHVRKALAVFLIIVTATVCWILFAPAKYGSIAKVYVRVGRENNTLDPSATTGQTVNIQQTLESEINSMLEVIGSEETVKRVVDEIGVETILANDLVDESDDESSSSSGGSSWISKLKSNVAPRRFSESREARAIRSLLKRSSFSAPKKSNVIEIWCVAGHPELAQRIAKAWTNAFIDEHLRVTRTDGSLDFFVQQLERNASRLQEAEQELRDAKTSAGLVTILGQQKLLEEQANSIRSRLLTNNSLLASSIAKVDELSEILKSLPERVDADQRVEESHQGYNNLRERLFELQIREHELKSKYSDEKSEVIAVVSQREAIEKILAAQSKSSSETISSPNPTYQKFQQSLLDEKALVASLKAERQSLEKQHEENRAEQTELNRNAVLISSLERKQQNLEASYLASFSSMEQARTLEGLEAANITSVNELQSANLSVIPTGLGRMKTLILGLFFGLIASVAVALGFEYFDRTFVTSGQVEHSLDVPVLVSIPKGRRHFVDVS